jgi:hypothetical protein
MDLVDLEFLELGCLAGKKWSVAVLLNPELLGALPNTPIGQKASFNSSQQVAAQQTASCLEILF